MIKENLALCRKKLEAAAAKAGIPSSQITLVAVTKGVASDLINEAIDNGITHIGENRVQEALCKYDAANEYVRKKGVRLTWHMIGHLQTNKVKEAVGMFDLIHSVDSLHLAEEIDRQAQNASKPQDVLIEVKTSPEATKYGIAPAELLTTIQKILVFKNIVVRGLMTVAPLGNDTEKTRTFFRLLKELKDNINRSGICPSPLSILSMGMTDDFQVAVEEGATMVRLGRAIFTERKE